MAKTTGHPGPLKTEFLDPKKMTYGEAGEPRWCIAVNDKSNTFASLSVCIFRREAILSPDRINKMDNAVATFKQRIAKSRQESSAHSGMTYAPFTIHTTDLIIHDRDSNGIDSPIRVIPTDDGRTGYVFVAGFGPGGAGYAAALPSADRRYDILVQTGVSYEGPGLNRTDESKLYQDRLKNQPFQLLWAAALVVDNALKTKEINPEQLGPQLRKTHEATLLGFDRKIGHPVPLSLLSSEPSIQAETNQLPVHPFKISYSNEDQEITVCSPGYRPRKVTLNSNGGMSMIGMERDETPTNAPTLRR